MKKPKNYYCHRTAPHPNSLPGQYQVLDKIGEGAFGEVFKIFNTNTSRIEVMKKMKGADQTGIRQTEVLTKLTASDGFAKIRETPNKEEIIIMQLLGVSLEEVMKHRLDVVDIKRIGYQCVQRLKQLHQRGYVHRDVKPENILLGNRNNPHKVYIVDFGLASTYKKKSLIARKCYQGQIGTIKFCPVASHLGLQQFPKEDLQSLGYVLVYVMFGSLPWNAVPKGLSEKEKFQAIKKIKQQIDIQKLTEGVACLKKFFKYVRKLKVGDPIQYDHLLEMFNVPCQDHYCYSFCSKDCHSKYKDEDDKQNLAECQQKIQAMKIPSSGFISSRQNRLC